MYRYFNPNPKGKLVGDCSIRAISLALFQGWEKTYKDVCNLGLALGDMPSSNAVWGTYLQDHGFHREIIPNSCPDCYSIRAFCLDNPILVLWPKTLYKLYLLNNIFRGLIIYGFDR